MIRSTAESEVRVAIVEERQRLDGLIDDAKESFEQATSPLEHSIGQTGAEMLTEIRERLARLNSSLDTEERRLNETGRQG